MKDNRNPQLDTTERIQAIVSLLIDSGVITAEKYYQEVMRIREIHDKEVIKK